MTKFSFTVEAEDARTARHEVLLFMGAFAAAGAVAEDDAHLRNGKVYVGGVSGNLTETGLTKQSQQIADELDKVAVKAVAKALAEDAEAKAAPVKRGRVAKVETVLTGDAKAAGQPAKPVVLDPDAASGDPADAGGSDDGEEVSLDDLPADSNKFNDWILDCVSRVTSTGKTDKITALKQIAGIMKENADGARSGEQLYMKKDPAMVQAVVQGVTKLVNDYVSG